MIYGYGWLITLLVFVVAMGVMYVTVAWLGNALRQAQGALRQAQDALRQAQDDMVIAEKNMAAKEEYIVKLISEKRSLATQVKNMEGRMAIMTDWKAKKFLGNMDSSRLVVWAVPWKDELMPFGGHMRSIQPEIEEYEKRSGRMVLDFPMHRRFSVDDIKDRTAIELAKWMLKNEFVEVVPDESGRFAEVVVYYYDKR